VKKFIIRARRELSMKPYFEKMTEFGKPLSEGQIKRSEENVKQIQEVEKTVAEAVEKVRKAGIAAEEINKRGEMTVYQRLEYLLDPGTWCPLHTLFDPMAEESGTTGVVDGLGRISGKWAVIIGFDNKVMAGAWIAGQSENILRVTDMASGFISPSSGWSIAAASSFPSRKRSMQTGEEAGRRFSGTRSWKNWASPSWRESTERTRRVEVTRGSVPRSFWPTRIATSPSAAEESSAA
jgi:hypothetical protein